jgi:hypothetical protein
MNTGLMMVVKDEEQVIERALLSAYRAGLRDWAIVDTGSADRTVEIINHMVAEYDVQAIVVRAHWSGFADARNLALSITERWPVDAPQYWLSLDADEEVSATGAPWEPTDDLVHIPLFNEGDGLQIWAARVLRHGTALRWFGRVHEGIDGPKGHHWAGGKSEAFSILSHSDGHRTTAGTRPQQNYELAMAELAEHPGVPRAVFYAALSTEGVGKKAEAIALFERRAKMYTPSAMGTEEAWYAAFRAGYLRATMADPTAPHHLLAAYAKRPWRSEPLAVLAFYWQEQGAEFAAMAHATYPAKRPWPANDWLFVDPSLYDPRPEMASVN